MNYIEEKPMSDFIRKIIDYCYSDNKSKLTAKDVIFMVMDCTVEHTVEDVQPVKHGEWIKILSYNGCTLCSECNSTGFPYWNYCCACGAKMMNKEF